MGYIEEENVRQRATDKYSKIWSLCRYTNGARHQQNLAVESGKIRIGRRDRPEKYAIFTPN